MALKGAFLGLLGAAMVIVVASAVVWPLWYLATAHTRTYTFLMLVAIAGGLVAVAWVRIKRHKADSANVSIGS
jgi:hypothetical protein